MMNKLTILAEKLLTIIIVLVSLLLTKNLSSQELIPDTTLNAENMTVKMRKYKTGYRLFTLSTGQLLLAPGYHTVGTIEANNLMLFSNLGEYQGEVPLNILGLDSEPFEFTRKTQRYINSIGIGVSNTDNILIFGRYSSINEVSAVGGVGLIDLEGNVQSLGLGISAPSNYFDYEVPYLTNSVSSFQSDGSLITSPDYNACINLYDDNFSMLTRVSTTGECDVEFANRSKATFTDSDNLPWVKQIFVDSDDKILASTIATRNSNKGCNVTTTYRFNSDGSIDNTFPPLESGSKPCLSAGLEVVSQLENGNYVIAERVNVNSGFYNRQFVKVRILIVSTLGEVVYKSKKFESLAYITPTIFNDGTIVLYRNTATGPRLESGLPTSGCFELNLLLPNGTIKKSAIKECKRTGFPSLLSLSVDSDGKLVGQYTLTKVSNNKPGTYLIQPRRWTYIP